MHGLPKLLVLRLSVAASSFVVSTRKIAKYTGYAVCFMVL